MNINRFNTDMDYIIRCFSLFNNSEGGFYMTMLTIMETVAVIATGCSIAILSFLIGLNQGEKE